jgi:hypothetical protein
MSGPDPLTFTVRHRGRVSARPEREVIRVGGSKRAPRSERRTRGGTPLGIRLASGLVAVVAALMLAATFPSASGSWRLVPVAVVAFAIGLYTVDPVAVAAVVVLAYLLFIGFLVNQFGVLSWHGNPDVYRLLAIAVPAGIGLLAGAVRRWYRRQPPLTVPPGWTASFAAGSTGFDIDEQGGVPR